MNGIKNLESLNYSYAIVLVALILETCYIIG